MNKLTSIYPQAIEQTKRKLYEDIYGYFQQEEELPEFERYLQDRSTYIEQIWLNVWLNKVTNDVPRSEKKNFLREKGIETEGVERKLINRLFRNEIRSYHPFNVKEWLLQEFQGRENDWEKRYHKAREDYVKWQQEEQLRVDKLLFQEDVEQAALQYFSEKRELVYLYARYFTAKQLHSDFTTKTKYQHVEDLLALEERLVEQGPFQPGNFTTLNSFFDEVTGGIHETTDWGRSYFEYETYYDLYKKLIFNYLYDFLPVLILDELPDGMKDSFKKRFHENITVPFVRESISELIYEITEGIVEEIQEEYITDLLKAAAVEFDPEIHKKLYQEDLQERERRRKEELAELKRRQEAEARMMEDIFGQEYNPGLGSRQIHYVLHIGDTNTGKTHQALERMKSANSGLYLAPLRLLALEVYDKLNADGVACSLKTGEEEKILPHAAHISSTVEMFHEKDFYEVIVIDEAQMITDKDRGFSWYKAITKANASEIHIIGSKNAKSMILQLLHNADIEIREYNRETPLEVEMKEFKLNQIKKGDALICFSRKRVLETASKLQNDGHTVSMIYGSMPPETRKKQMKQFIEGRTKVIVSTDAIGMGLNLPIRRIVFLENEKFDGSRRRRLTSQEVKQIAGRAGRKGIYDVGKVAFVSEIKTMRRLLFQEDEPVHTFAIAPTNPVFERFQKYYHDLGTFFELWEEFKSPAGTKKAALSEEKALYEMIRGTEVEARFSLIDLYGFLHLPFSSNEPGLTVQWEQTMYAIMMGSELPEPVLKDRNLEDLELSYKAIGLHLLFLYRLDRRTEALYWERVREEISDQVHETLKKDLKKFTKKCKQCGRNLSWESPFQICDACYAKRNRYSKERDYR